MSWHLDNKSDVKNIHRLHTYINTMLEDGFVLDKAKGALVSTRPCRDCGGVVFYTLEFYNDNLSFMITVEACSYCHQYLIA